MKTGTKLPVSAAILAASSLMLCPLHAADPSKPQPLEDAVPVVQIAILLDTSGSMEGLIAQAKTQLWKIVNEFITAKQNGKTPVVQVALYEYGNDTADAKQNYVRQLLPLSRDLDKVSEQLFKLTTNGGEEYCGAAIQTSIKDLGWDASPNTYKAIFIAGNEPFNQGPIEPIKECRNAIAKGVIVNTIHCGPDATGRATQWQAGAQAADGKYLVIDQNQTVVSIQTPQDAEIVKLNEELNKTYISYGRLGAAGKENQVAQDKNAEDAAPAAAQSRAVTKASSNYSNASWDIVDRCKQKDFDISKMKEEDLPEEMKKMTVEERKAHVEKLTARRAEVQAQILDVGKKRDAYIAEKAKETGKDDTLGTAVTKAVREQAEKKQIVWEE